MQKRPLNRQLRVTTQRTQELEDRAWQRSLTPEQRLELLEILRREGGKWLYDYPARLQRVVTVIRKA
jgi:hypothetical protein